MSNYQQALDKIERNKYRISRRPDLIGVGMMSPMVKTYQEIKPWMIAPGQTPTMATDGKNIFVGPDFVNNECSDSQLRFVILHEFYHIAFKHQLRIGDKTLDRRLTNQAMDYLINAILRRTTAFKTGFITWPDGGLYAERFDDPKLTWEAIYKILLSEQDDEPEEEEENNDDDGGSSGAEDNEQESEDGEGSGSDSSGGTDDSMGDDEAEQPDGSGSGDSPSSEQGEGSGQEPLGHGDWGEIWEPQHLTPEEEDEMAKAIDEQIADGEFAEKSWGVGSGSQSSLGVVKQERDRVSSWDMLRDMLETMYSEERTWSRPHVVFQQQGYLPSRVESVGTLHVCIDMSASFSRGEIQLSLENTIGICEQIGVSKVKVAYVDSAILRPHGETWAEFDIDMGDEIDLDIVGRGGTQFDPIFHAIEDECEDVTALVYFTDGEGYVGVPEPDFPVIWATTAITPWFHGNQPFGEVVEIAEDIRREELFYA